MWTDPLVVCSAKHPAGSQALEHRQIFHDDKSHLDGAIETALRYGWKLLSRSFSSEKGHGADLVRSRMNKAA